MDVALHNIHLSALDNSKMTSQTHKYVRFLQITIRKCMFTLTYVELEIETSISIWESELIELK